MKKLETAEQVVEALGGPQAVAKLTKASIKRVWNWHGYFGEFPARKYLVMTRALERLGYTAPPHLWKQDGFEKTKRAA